MTQQTKLLFDDSVFPDITIPALPPAPLTCGSFVRFKPWLTDTDLIKRYQQLIDSNFVFEVVETELDWGPEETTLTLFIRVKPE